MAVTVAAAVVAVVMLEAVGAVPHIAAAAALGVRVGCAAVTRLALISGRQDRCKAQCSCLGPSSKPCLRGTWSSTCHNSNNHNN